MAYIANPVAFDGTNDFLTRGGGLTGAADSASFSVSFWVRRAALISSAAVQRVICTTTAPKFAVHFDSLEPSIDHISVVARNSAGTIIANFGTASPISDTTNWHHIALSSNGVTAQSYLDGVSSLAENVPLVNEAIDFLGPADWAIGSTPAATNKLPADLADVWFIIGTRIDFSVPANLAKFLAGGGPVDLGADGSVPTGSAPILYLTGATSTWHTNAGTGGGFTENGALADGSISLPVGEPTYTQTKFRLYSNTGSDLGA